MTEYTPTTEQVRERYWLATVNDTDFPGADGYANDKRAEFDRWLAEVRREAAEKAWDGGAEMGYRLYDEPLRVTLERNPYRAGQ